MSITTRFLLGFTLVASLGLYFLLANVLQRVERQYMEAAEEPMVDVANVLAEMLAAETPKGGALQTGALAQAWQSAQSRTLQARIYTLVKERVDMQVYVVDAQGRMLFDSAGRETPGATVRHRDVFLTLHGGYGARVTRSNPDDPLSVIMYVGAPIVAEGNTIGVVSVAKPLRSLMVFIHETEKWLKGMMIAAVALMALGLFFVARWATRPLNELTQHALAVSRGERPPPPHMPGHQMKTLGHALEHMRDALEGREYVESYVQSLTHELKSPVAAILGAGEILQGDVPEPQRTRFLQNIRTEADRLRDLLERLLHLAGLEKQKKLATREPVDLGEVLARAWDHLTFVAAAKDVRLDKDVSVDLILSGDPWLIEIAFSNLLQNALDFAPNGSRILARAFRFEDHLVLQIEDQGPGIPDYARERVFERFYSLPRPDTGKKSTGLGLCFVKEVAQLHGGTAELGNAEHPPGTRATLLFPTPG
ncbi:MAG: two-component system sensor histidine kinase CreC [Prosthecobacter sp.]|nr:two-component system sensor histidine kinase CreC [Prosthecobacter sp.]